MAHGVVGVLVVIITIIILKVFGQSWLQTLIWWQRDLCFVSVHFLSAVSF